MGAVSAHDEALFMEAYRPALRERDSSQARRWSDGGPAQGSDRDRDRGTGPVLAGPGGSGGMGGPAAAGGGIQPARGGIASAVPARSSHFMLGQSTGSMSAPVMNLFDARPLLNAQANRANGGGFEAFERYCGGAAKLHFLDIANIHAVRKALSGLRTALLRGERTGLHASTRGGSAGRGQGEMHGAIPEEYDEDEDSDAGLG